MEKEEENLYQQNNDNESNSKINDEENIPKDPFGIVYIIFFLQVLK
jgi:hypothetical protein